MRIIMGSNHFLAAGRIAAPFTSLGRSRDP